jgi:predicted transglutaminase-like cysteine proteinase
MIIRHDTAITDKFPELYNSISNSYLKNAILFFLDSDTRKATNLRNWIKKLMNEPISEEMKKVLLSIPDNTNYDVQVLNCLKWVSTNIKYVKDSNKWSLPDRWCTPDETLTLEVTTKNGTHYGPRQGDCEDGAILLYYLCRCKGVPANRLLLFCGDVQGGGHCWLTYKPRAYPLNFVFLDWCYDKNIQSTELRHKFYVNSESKMSEFKNDDKTRIKSNYQSIWWAWNEETNIKNFKYDPKNRLV